MALTPPRGVAARAGRILAAGLALTALTAAPAHACSVCGCGDPLVAVAEGPGRGGDLRLGLEGEVLSQRAAGDLAGTREVLHQSTIRVTGVYSPAEPLNLVVAVPLVRKRLDLDLGGTSEPTSDVSGLGDMEVGARWFVLQRTDLAARRRQGLALSVGTSIPTGRTGARDRSGAVVDQHGQLGTGGWGPTAGVSWRLQQDPWSLTASLAGRLHTANPERYRYGDALLWTAQGQWSPREWLAVGLGLEGREAWRDVDAGERVANTGGLVLAVTPSVFARLGGGLWLQLRAQLPVAARLVGDQAVGPTVVAGLAWQAE
jgi:hypothetical protein